jgi:hypothetical protein
MKQFLHRIISRMYASKNPAEQKALYELAESVREFGQELDDNTLRELVLTPGLCTGNHGECAPAI